MSEIVIDKTKIPLKAYLRADPNSQHFKFRDDSSEFVTHDIFWGDESGEGLYLDYSLIKNRSIEISEGISENPESQILWNNDCDRWINENIINSSASKLFVIQGYAGCGKTTFVHHLLNNIGHSNMDFIHIDIGQRWSFPSEPNMFFTQSLIVFSCAIENLVKLKRHEREKIWEKFISLGSDIEASRLGIEITNIISSFITIKRKSSWKNLRVNLHHHLNDTYGGSVKNSIWHSVGQTQAIVSLLILLKCAEYTVSQRHKSSESKLALIFDNLDIITNPAIPAENVFLLWDVISRYIDYKKNYQTINQESLPDALIFITVRKVLYAHIASHLPDLEMAIMNNPTNIVTCDISRLYLSQSILAHRIDYWIKHITVRSDIEKLEQLKEIIVVNDMPIEEEKIEDEFSPKKTINLDAFLNYNYRAFSNAISMLLDDSDYKKHLLPELKSTNSSESWKKVSTLIFLLSLLYKKERIWNTLGFGCRDFSYVDYPTTLNRLILNYLYTARRGQVLCAFSDNRPDIPVNNYVSLKEIVETLKDVKFLRIDTRFNQAQIDKKYESYAVDMEDLILDRIADMCARTSRASGVKNFGYDTDEDELWRRPLYFIGGLKLYHTATSYDELKTNFRHSIEEKKSEKVLLSITEEGCILISDFFANFEFYSARYGNNSAKPLHHATSKEEIDNIIYPVYDAIKKCCERNGIFMNQYMEHYNLTIDQYLQKFFHPRTKPRFEDGDILERRLTGTSFRPQLHIVRVIYSHIGYFNITKEYISVSNLSEKNLMCKCLTDWIKAYLELYNHYFFNLLNKTVCEADNHVYSSLLRLLKRQLKQYSEGGKWKNVNIKIDSKKGSSQSQSTRNRKSTSKNSHVYPSKI